VEKPIGFLNTRLYFGAQSLLAVLLVFMMPLLSFETYLSNWIEGSSLTRAW
jgi:hypothetical protein